MADINVVLLDCAGVLSTLDKRLFLTPMIKRQIESILWTPLEYGRARANRETPLNGKAKSKGLSRDYCGRDISDVRGYHFYLAFGGAAMDNDGNGGRQGDGTEL